VAAERGRWRGSSSGASGSLRAFCKMEITHVKDGTQRVMAMKQEGRDWESPLLFI
jgi:hypothetical protein